LKKEFESLLYLPTRSKYLFQNCYTFNLKEEDKQTETTLQFVFSLEIKKWLILLTFPIGKLNDRGHLWSLRTTVFDPETEIDILLNSCFPEGQTSTEKRKLFETILLLKGIRSYKEVKKSFLHWRTERWRKLY